MIERNFKIIDGLNDKDADIMGDILGYNMKYYKPVYGRDLKMSIPRWRSHPIHENRATKSIWTEPCNPLLSATKSTKRATSA